MIHRLLVLLVLVLWSDMAWGQFLSPVVLNPNPAHTSENVFVEFITGPCTAVLGGADNPIVEVIDDSIDVLIDGRWESNIQLCFFPPNFQQSINVGSFPPGEYTVTVRFRYEPLFQPPQIEVLGVLDLSVQGVSSLRPVPSLTVWGLSSLFVLLLSIGVWTCARPLG